MNRLTNDMQDFGATRNSMDAAIDRFAHDKNVLIKGVISNVRVLIHEGRTDDAIRTLNRLQYYVMGDT